MLFERFEVEGLSHYSYAVGCPGAGKIAIVDPRRETLYGTASLLRLKEDSSCL